MKLAQTETPNTGFLATRPNCCNFFPALGYGFGFVCLICIISNVGGCLIPFMKLRLYQRLLMFCVAMGAGVMVSTGCLVLIPEVRFWDNIIQLLTIEALDMM